MKNKGKKNENVSKIPVVVLLGVIIGLLCTLVAAAIGTYLIASEKIGEDRIEIAAGMIQFVGALFATLAAMNLAKDKKLAVCALTAGAFYLSLIAITGMFFGGQYNNLGTSALLVLSGSGTVVIAGIMIGKRHNSPKRKYAYR